MDTDLLTEAKHLACLGWLPGIYVAVGATTVGNTMTVAPSLYCEEHPQDPTTVADLHLAAHNEIVRRGWSIMVVTKHDTTTLYDWKLKDDSFEIDWEWSIERPGTTTLSLLRCLLAACEEHERNEGGKR